MNVVAGLHGAVEQIDGVRQLFFEFPHTQDMEDRNQREGDGDAQSQNDQINAEQAQTEVHNSSNEKTEGQHFGSAVLQVGLIDVILQAARDGHPSEQIAEEREPATPF